MGVGDTKVGAVDKVGLAAAAAAGILMDEGALGIWSTKAGVRGPPAAVTGTEASRVEAGAEVLSEAASSEEAYAKRVILRHSPTAFKRGGETEL